MNRNMIIGVVALVALVASAFVFFNMEDEKTEEITEEFIGGQGRGKVLYVVTSPWKPYEYEEDGEYKGLAVELLDRVMTDIDVPYTFELLPWTRALKLAELGGADGLYVATYTPEREEFLYFSPEQVRYYLEGGDIPESSIVTGEYVFFVRSALIDSISFESVEQIIRDEHRVGISQDYIYAFLPTDNPNLLTTEFIDHKKGMQAMFEGQVDMFVVEKLVGLSTARDLGIQDKVTFIELNLDEALFPLYLIFSKNSDYPDMEQLGEKVNQAIIELKASGEYDEIYDEFVRSLSE